MKIFQTVFFLYIVGSAFAEDYDPRPDVFDQVINTLVPIFIISFFTINPEKITNSWFFKLCLLFDDILFLVSIYILPIIVMTKSEYERRFRILIVYGFAAFIVFVGIILTRIKRFQESIWVFFYFIFLMPISHGISDICFLFYSKAIHNNTTATVFIFLHAVSEIFSIVASFFLLMSISMFILFDNNDNKIIFFNFFSFFSLFYIYSPIIQMLNMALLSGNDYYWTKLVFALNLIYLSRILNYFINISKFKKEDISLLLFLIFGAYDEKGSYFRKIHDFLKYEKTNPEQEIIEQIIDNSNNSNGNQQLIEQLIEQLKQILQPKILYEEAVDDNNENNDIIMNENLSDEEKKV